MRPGRPSCEDCRDLHVENGDGLPDCAALCPGKPEYFTRKNAQAWEAWNELDRFGRDIDTMSGFPLSLRIADVEGVCARYDDPDGIRWRVLLIEEDMLRHRRDDYQVQRKQRGKP